MAGDIPVGPEHPGIIAAGAGVIGTVLGSFGLWLANRTLGKAAFQTAINAGFQALTDQLQEERDALRRDLTAERLAWEGERASLRGEIRNLNQMVESLRRELMRAGIDLPRQSGAGRDPEPGATIIETTKV